MLSGEWVCDECWLAVAQDQIQFGVRRTERAVGPRLVPMARRARAGVQIQATSLTPSRPGPNARTTQPGSRPHWDRRGPQALSRSTLDIITPTINSVCYSCSHIFYGASMAKCSRCGGLCYSISDHGLAIQVRRAIVCIEGEV